MKRSIKTQFRFGIVAAAIASVIACDSDNNKTVEAPTPAPAPAPAPTPTPSPSDQFPEGAILLPADGDVTKAAKEAFILAQSGDTIVFPEGHFSINSTLLFDGDADGDGFLVENITIMGYGTDRTTLDFADANSGDGIFVQNAKNVTIKDMAVVEAKNNGIKLKDTDGIILRNLSVRWDGELTPDNGAYGLYPVETSNVLIEDCYVRGSADAGIYVGQSTNIVVRNSTAKENVAGIEIENSKYADVYNNTAIGNTAGILVFDLPINNHKYGSTVRLFNNTINDNNTPNFANASANPAGVHIAPPGSGIIVLSTPDVEIFNNSLDNNGTSSIIVSSFFIAEQDLNKFIANYAQPGQPISDGWRAVPRNIYVHDNTISNSSRAPAGKLITDIIQGYLTIYGEFPSVLYDGLGESLANSGAGIAYGLMEPPFAEDGSDNVCATNNGDHSYGQLYVNNPVTPAFGFESPQDSLMNCTLPRLPASSATIGGVTYGCGHDDDDAACSL